MGTELVKIDGRLPAAPAQLAKYLKQQITSIAGASASNINPDKLCRIVVRSVQMNPKLQECNMLSIFRAALQSAELGLEIGGATGQAYLVPFGKQAQFVPGYKGLVTLAYRSGMIEDVAARVVYKDDEFSIDLAQDPPFSHKPCLTGSRTDKDIVCFYCVVRVRGSAYPHFDYMTKGEVDAIRNASAGRNADPWVVYYAEQGKKTVAKRALKMIPLSPEIAKGIALDNATESGDFSEVVFDYEVDNPELETEPPITRQAPQSGEVNVERAAVAAAKQKRSAVTVESVEDVPHPADTLEADPKLLVPAKTADIDKLVGLAKQKGKKIAELENMVENKLQNITQGQANMLLGWLEAH